MHALKRRPEATRRKRAIDFHFRQEAPKNKTHYDCVAPYNDGRRPLAPQKPANVGIVSVAFRDLLKRDVLNRVFVPILIVEVPPLRRVHSEALFLHLPPQQVPMSTFFF